MDLAVQGGKQKLKELILISLIILLLSILTVKILKANWTWFDTVYNFDYAYVKLPTGKTIEGECDNWRDYEDSDQLQVTINGVTYLSAGENIVLVHGYQK